MITIKTHDISDFLFEKNFKTVQAKRPKTIPCVILNVNGISTKAKKHGIPSERSFQLILLIGESINVPTKTKAIELATLGTSETKGDKNIRGKNKKAAIMAV